MNLFCPSPAPQRGRSALRQNFTAWNFASFAAVALFCNLCHAAASPTVCTLPAEIDADTLQQLDAIALDCLKSAPYFRRRGHLETAQGLSEAALESFEKALMLEPDHAGSQLDYAQAMIAVHDEPSALELIKQLLARDDVPPHLLPRLQRQLKDLNLAVLTSSRLANVDEWHSRTTLSQSIGYDTNLNNAFSLSTLLLTAPQGNIELEVDKNSTPKAGGVASTTLQWIGLRPWDGNLWIVQADARNRYTASSDQQYAQGDLAVTWLQSPDAPRQWIVRAASSSVLRAGSPLYESRLGSVLYQWAGSFCRPVAGIEAESRRYPQSETLKGAYTGISLSSQCAMGESVPGGVEAVDNSSSIGFGMRFGLDRPYDTLRAGGTQGDAEFRARWQGKLQITNLQLDYIWQRQVDQSGYSSLLDNNAVRHVIRNSLRLEASVPVMLFTWGKPLLYGTVEVAHQRSNIEIFNVLQTAVTFGLRWSL